MENVQGVRRKEENQLKAKASGDKTRCERKVREGGWKEGGPIWQTFKGTFEGK